MSELEQYLANPMKPAADMPPAMWPLPDEHHLSWWRALIDAPGDLLERLGQSLPQIRIAAESGISKSDTYAGVVFRGESLDASGLRARCLEHPEEMSLRVHKHYAGSLPVFETPHRSDFEHLYRAIGSRCEPVAVPSGVHALFVSGIPNAGRMGQLKDSWGDDATWPSEMKRLLGEGRSWFYDRVILMHRGPYGGVSANRVLPTMSEREWIDRSSTLRLEHEFTHYATSRMLGSFRLNLHDELIADFMGCTKALGTFTADMFMEAMGVSGASIPKSARLRHYTVGLSEEEVQSVLQASRKAAMQLEVLSKELPNNVCRGRLVMAIGQVSLSGMASSDFSRRVLERS